MTNPSPQSESPSGGITVRHDVRPGDLGALVRLHGLLYWQEYGYDHTFEPYVARPMADYILSLNDRQRIWIVELNGEITGCLAVVEASDEEAQLRWFLLDPKLRGRKIGRRLIEEALAFCREAGYRRAFLLTVDRHREAITLYLSLGFRVTDEHPAELWGAVRTEQRYDLVL